MGVLVCVGDVWRPNDVLGYVGLIQAGVELKRTEFNGEFI